MAHSDFFILCELLSAATKLSYGPRDWSPDAQCLLPIEIGGNYFAGDRTLCLCVCACVCVRAMPA